MGFGNMLPHGKSRISIPFEIGAQFSTAPTLQLVLEGNACTPAGCSDINSQDGPQNLRSEVQTLQSDLGGLRIFPIVAVGVSYKFGR